MLFHHLYGLMHILQSNGPRAGFTRAKEAIAYMESGLAQETPTAVVKSICTLDISANFSRKNRQVRNEYAYSAGDGDAGSLPQKSVKWRHEWV